MRCGTSVWLLPWWAGDERKPKKKKTISTIFHIESSWSSFIFSSSIHRFELMLFEGCAWLENGIYLFFFQSIYEQPLSNYIPYFIFLLGFSSLFFIVVALPVIGIRTGYFWYEKEKEKPEKMLHINSFTLYMLLSSLGPPFNGEKVII